MTDLGTVDVESITLGEMLDIEQESGLDFLALAKTRTGTLMIAAYLASRRRGEPMTWSELANRRLLAKSSSASPSVSD